MQKRPILKSMYETKNASKIVWHQLENFQYQALNAPRAGRPGSMTTEENKLGLLFKDHGSQHEKQQYIKISVKD
jgi:hypothetical protein